MSTMSINQVAFYQECNSLVGYGTHYLHMYSVLVTCISYHSQSSIFVDLSSG